MGIVLNQSAKNTVLTYLGFGIGAINVLFLYTKFLSPEYFGLITYILSTANILMPLMAFGVHNTIIKFYSSFRSKQSQNSFLILMLFLPFAIIIPAGILGCLFFSSISEWLSGDNPIVKDYVWHIYIAAVSFAYFEVFYAWSRVQMQSVFGNFMKEVFHRILTTLLLVCLYLDWLTVDQLIWGIVGIYILRMIVMKLYAYSLRFPSFKLSKIPNLSAILKYSALIIIAGSVANVILEIDKFMINYYVPIENVAFYGVAIYIATVIGVPSRSLHQITSPLTAKLLNEKDRDGLKLLYQKSSINLFIITGFIFLIIVLNINQLYMMLEPGYADGLVVVFVIGLAKLMEGIIGNNNAILFNSDYYRMVLILGVFLAILTVILNALFIPLFGINGAAFATLLAMFFYSASKVGFVYKKFRMSPFTSNTVKVFILILVCMGAFYFWDFSFHPIVNIGLKSLLIALGYGIIVYTLNLSEDINQIINKLLNR
ncbi:oligosaccharide flippase family protein [Mangrovimonas sp. CR14]|uniref:lipopolysaccharide biosynthesis protein n=1 Tax=Mangrovimonas sp. CR14 TaxID=2706120 RepID=UPI001420A57E|nr:polysaccharide biosynthesis C-terminal domain-containing protein [Mangrovimonas sp. CR14]NIK91941.1 oligosaccharide flippase family protein [Mangrovimonas sp. CR14]